MNVGTGPGHATLTTDTTADTGIVDDFDFGPLTLGSTTRVGEHHKIVDTIVIPPNFPLPGQTIFVTETWREQITFDGFSSDFSQLLPSSAVPIVGGLSSPFSMRPNVVTSLTPFLLSGTYQLTGPTESASTPFSVEYQPTISTLTFPITFTIPGGATFGNGFDFSTGLVQLHQVTYAPVNPLIFTGTVDGETFNVELQPMKLTLSTFRIPEPSALAMATIAIAMGARKIPRRHRPMRGCKRPADGI
jgi:hypothetical protein